LTIAWRKNLPVLWRWRTGLNHGVISALNATDPVMIFQSVALDIGNLDEDQFQFVRQFYEFFTYLMMALIGVHIVAAGYHHFVAKDDSTRRMLKFWQTKSN
jgi:cytochrome b561